MAELTAERDAARRKRPSLPDRERDETLEATRDERAEHAG